MKLTGITPTGVGVHSGLAGICPYCAHRGVFVPATGQSNDLNASGKALVGFRTCSNANCRGLVVIFYKGNDIVGMYPHQRVNIDSTALPDEIAKCLNEAADCFSIKAYTASAMMVRKTLELLCHDRDAGTNEDSLKKRIGALCESVIIPKELLAGAQSLRLLGNDAAHVKARAFTEIGAKELEIAFKFAKEILKAVYQYSSLLAELETLKKPDPEAGDYKDRSG